MIKSWILGFVGRVLRVGEMRSAQEILMGNSEGRGQLEDLGINGNIILKMILRVVVRGYRLHPSTSG
jgi:hypothetical protein